MKKTPEDIINDIRDACESLGWNIAMNESSNTIRGLVIGQFDYVEEVVDQIHDTEEYSIYSPAESIDTDLH